ncbi:MAG: divalent-cation tolerance protein CutA [Betaproteobacteria bacterium]|nr:divalent-cation tolerance protein CutA [Betaproteobacteria bacterium]MDH3436311.1 divalent-cation tolerance protein CutA [Betaproteobacteria bacterium]
MSEALVVVLTNLPDRAAALELARELIARRLAACVNVLAECTSVYRWQGKVENATEVPVLIKTRAALYPEVETAISELHPYELPEIIAVPVGCGLADYLDWVSGETTISIG